MGSPLVPGSATALCELLVRNVYGLVDAVYNSITATLSQVERASLEGAASANLTAAKAEGQLAVRQREELIRERDDAQKRVVELKRQLQEAAEHARVRCCSVTPHCRLCVPGLKLNAALFTPCSRMPHTLSLVALSD